MRNPLVVAKAVGTAAVISNNRVQLGIGTGWCEEEFDLLEQPFAKRGKRTDEMIELLRAMWQPGWVEHHGEFYDIPRLEMTPVPTERGADLRRRDLRRGDETSRAPRRLAGRLPHHRGCDRGPRQARPLAGGVRPLERALLPRRAARRRVACPTTSAEPKTRASPTSSPCRGPFYGGLDAPLDQKIEGLARYYDDIVAPVNNL